MTSIQLGVLHRHRKLMQKQRRRPWAMLRAAAFLTRKFGATVAVVYPKKGGVVTLEPNGANARTRGWLQRIKGHTIPRPKGRPTASMTSRPPAPKSQEQDAHTRKHTSKTRKVQRRTGKRRGKTKRFKPERGRKDQGPEPVGNSERTAQIHLGRWRKTGSNKRHPLFVLNEWLPFGNSQHAPILPTTCKDEQKKQLNTQQLPLTS